MEAEIADLIQRVQERIRTATAAGNFAEVGNLAAMAQKLNVLADESRRLQREITEICNVLEKAPVKANGASQCADDARTNPVQKIANADLKLPTGNQRRAPIEVTIDWSAAGHQLARETIAWPRGAQTLRSFVTRVWEVLGAEKLALIHAVSTGRGPLVSNQPSIEFVNNVQGCLYAHHPIGASGWYVITHSESEEKVDYIRKAAALLRLPVEVRKVVELPHPSKPDLDEDTDQI